MALWRLSERKWSKPMIVHQAKNVRRVLSRAAGAGLVLIAVWVPSHAQSVLNHHEERKSAMTMTDDLANRSPDIHWPECFDPARADLFSHNELVINAPCEKVRRPIN